MTSSHDVFMEEIVVKASEIEEARVEAEAMLADAGIVLSTSEEIEITDFGKKEYRKTGLGLVVRLNEQEYASKWLTLLPGQSCPNHFHKIIKETFFIISGDVRMELGEKIVEMKPSDKITLPAGTWHKFSSANGAVIEEITTHQVKDDSYFEDPSIERYVTIE